MVRKNCVLILLGNISPSGSPTFKGSLTYRGEATIFSPVTEQSVAAGKVENTHLGLGPTRYLHPGAEQHHTHLYTYPARESVCCRESCI